MVLKYHTVESENGFVRFGKSKKLVKKNAMTILKNTALQLTPNKKESFDESIAKDLELMEKETSEKKLLSYQLLTGTQKVNHFLLNKYSDSFNLTTASIDRYDNSQERYSSGLNYEYHVYLPENTEYNELRVENKYIISKAIKDKKNGDIYYYHIPIYYQPLDSSIKTDFGEVIDISGSSKSKDGLLFALTELSKAIEKNVFLLSNDILKILQSHGLIDDLTNKLKLDIIGNVLVEKYLLQIKVDKRNDAINYLNSLEGIHEDQYEKKIKDLKEEYQKKFDKLTNQITKLKNSNEKLEEKEVRIQNKLVTENAVLDDVNATSDAKSEAEKKSEQLTKELKAIQDASKVITDKISSKEEIEDKLINERSRKEDKILDIYEPLDEDGNKGGEDKGDEQGDEDEELSFTYHSGKNLLENLIENGYTENILYRNGISLPLKITPLFIINPKQKNFYMIIDRSGVNKLITGTQLNINNINKVNSYLDMITNGKIKFIKMSNEEMEYLRKRKITITSKIPVVIQRSSEFKVNPPDVREQINNLLNK